LNNFEIEIDNLDNLINLFESHCETDLAYCDKWKEACRSSFY